MTHLSEEWVTGGQYENLEHDEQEQSQIWLMVWKQGVGFGRGIMADPLMLYGPIMRDYTVQYYKPLWNIGYWNNGYRFWSKVFHWLDDNL